MYSLILSLILACGEAEVDPEQKAKEEAQRDLEKQRKKHLFQVERSINRGLNDDGLSTGLILYNDVSTPKLAQLLVQASYHVQNPEALLDKLEKAKLPKEVAEEIQFRLLLQKADKSEATAFAASLSDEDRKIAFFLDALQNGAVIDFQHPLVLAGKAVITSKDASLLEGMEDLSSVSQMCTFASLAMDAGRPDLAAKYASSLQESKDVKSKFCGLSAAQKYAEALALAHEHNLIEEGSRLIDKIAKQKDAWNILVQVQSPEELIKKSSWALIPYAKVALTVGEYSTALDFSSEYLKEASNSYHFQSAVHIQGKTAFFLRDNAALTETIKLVGENQTIYPALLALSNGKLMPAGAFDGLSVREKIEWVLHTANNDKNIAEMLPEIIVQADELGDPALRVATRFAHEAYLRSFTNVNTAELLEQMDAEFGESYPHVRTEIMIRKSLLALPVSLALPSDASISERSWQSYLAGAIPVSEDPIPLMLIAMQILKQRKGYEQFINIMWQKTPIHRVGPLTTNTVIDLSSGLLFDEAVMDFIGTQKLEEIAQCLIFQDLARRGEILRKEAYFARNPVLGMESSNRKALLDAVARVRIQIQAYWMGESFPEKEFAQLHQIEARLLMDDEQVEILAKKEIQKEKEVAVKEKAAEKVEEKEPKKEEVAPEAQKKQENKEAAPEREAKDVPNDKPVEKTEVKEKKEEPKADYSVFAKQLASLKEDMSYRNLVLSNNMDLNFLQSNIRKVVILSYRVYKGDLIGLAFSDSTGQLLNLGKASRLFELSAQQKEILRQDKDDPSILAPNSEKHIVANTLKNRIFEPFNNTTQRLVSMIFIAPPELEPITFGTLPDQQNGLRFLNGMRRVSSVPGLSELLRSSKLRSKKLEMLAIAEEVENPEETDILRSGKENQPVEIDQISLSFKSDDREVLIGTKSSIAKYREEAPMARFIYFAQAKSSDNGGFLFNEDELTLSEIATTPLKAKLVFLSEHPNPEIQQRRVHAFLNAGARNVLVFDWALANQVKRAMLDKIFESLLRDEPVTEAISKISKNNLGLKSQDGVKKNGPGTWGALHLYGYPDRIGN